MSARTSLTARVEQYLAERRCLGFELKHMGQSLALARYVKASRHRGPLTVELMASCEPPRAAAATRPRRPCPAHAATFARCSSTNPLPRCPEAIFGPFRDA